MKYFTEEQVKALLTAQRCSCVLSVGNYVSEPFLNRILTAPEPYDWQNKGLTKWDVKMQKSENGENTIKHKELMAQHEFICNQYIREFCSKQGMTFDFWVADLVGDVAHFNGHYFFNFSDIVLDINTSQPKGAIMRWYDENLEDMQTINYYSYTKGLRVEQLKANAKQDLENFNQ